MIDHLIVVDDRADGRQIAKSTSDRLGLTLLEFSHPREALPALLELNRPFVLILDHNFEDEEVQGYHLCNELRQQHPFGLILPIIYLSAFMSGDSYLELIRDQLTFAPTAFMDKKDPSELTPMVRNIIRTFDGILEAAEKQAASQALSALSELY